MKFIALCMFFHSSLHRSFYFCDTSHVEKILLMVSICDVYETVIKIYGIDINVRDTCCCRGHYVPDSNMRHYVSSHSGIPLIIRIAIGAADTSNLKVIEQNKLFTQNDAIRTVFPFLATMMTIFCAPHPNGINCLREKGNLSVLKRTRAVPYCGVSV